MILSFGTVFGFLEFFWYNFWIFRIKDRGKTSLNNFSLLKLNPTTSFHSVVAMTIEKIEEELEVFGHDHRQGCPGVQGPCPSGEEIDCDHNIHFRHEGAEDDACGIERMILFLFSFTSGKG